MSAALPQEIQRGTRKYRALVALHALGGEAFIHDWCHECWFGKPSIFHAEIIDCLAKLKMIHVVDDTVTIMNAGLWVIGKTSHSPGCKTATVAGPRAAPSGRPLSPANMPRLQVARPGALDYMHMPSLMSGERVPHHATVITSDGAPSASLGQGQQA